MSSVPPGGSFWRQTWTISYKKDAECPRFVKKVNYFCSIAYRTRFFCCQINDGAGLGGFPGLSVIVSPGTYVREAAIRMNADGYLYRSTADLAVLYVVLASSAAVNAGFEAFAAVGAVDPYAVKHGHSRLPPAETVAPGH